MLIVYLLGACLRGRGVAPIPRTWIAAATILPFAFPLLAQGRLSISLAATNPGETDFAIVYEAGPDPISAMQFDVEVSGGRLAAVAPGDAVKSASKELASAAISSRVRRGVVFGGDRFLGGGAIALARITRTDEELSQPLILRVGSIKATTEDLKPLALEDVSFSSSGTEPPTLAKPVPHPTRIKAGAACSCDLNGDEIVTVSDLQVLHAMRMAEVGLICDLTQDGVLDEDDVGTMLNAINDEGCVLAKSSTQTKSPAKHTEEK